MNRLGIYFFYDRNGVADDYVAYFLARFKPFCRELCIVVNGDLTPQSEQLLRPFCTRLIKRKNEGFDAWAYKAALDAYGPEKLAAFDEVVLTNFTVFGPFYPLNALFEKMDATPGNFWGPFRWSIYNPQTQSFIHPLPTYFIAYRRSLVQSEAFKRYWTQLPPIHSYEESVRLHEQRQTQYYEQHGFRAAVWLDHNPYRKFWRCHWPFACARDLIEKKGFPFLKRRQFFIDDGHFTWGWNNLQIVRYLKKNGLYDTSLIYKNICRTQAVHTLPRHNFNWKGFCYRVKSWLHYSPPRKAKAKRYLITQRDFHQAFEEKQP